MMGGKDMAAKKKNRSDLSHLVKLHFALAEARLTAIAVAEAWAKKDLGPKSTRQEQHELAVMILEKYVEKDVEVIRGNAMSILTQFAKTGDI